MNELIGKLSRNDFIMEPRFNRRAGAAGGGDPEHANWLGHETIDRVDFLGGGVRTLGLGIN